MDVHSFRVQDDNDPPNVSEELEFVVKVLPVDDIPPSLYPNTSLHVSLNLVMLECRPNLVECYAFFK